MSGLRIIIADDERPAREFLKSLLREMSNVEVVGEAASGAEALDLIEAVSPDLALLDLQMPELSGLDVAKRITGPNMPLVAFVTAFDEFAVKAFELNAIDYLLKPVEKDRLRQTLERAEARTKRSGWHEEETARLQNAVEFLEDPADAEPLERIPVKDREEILLIPVKEVASIIADGELLRIATADRRRFTINYRLKDIEPRLDERMFVRLSRSALVNIDLIAKVSPLPGGTFQVSLKNGQEVPTSRQQSKLLRTRLLRL